MAEICGDNRFEVIERAKRHLLDGTNIDTSPGEMAVLDSFLFRCWQMGWLDRYDDTVVAIMPMTLENAINFLDEIGWRAEHDRIMSTPQWIPCEERLPEKDQLVLCQCRAGIIDVLRLKPNGFWENLNPYVNYMPGFVIAWMPLPEPYEGERKDNA